MLNSFVLRALVLCLVGHGLKGASGYGAISGIVTSASGEPAALASLTLIDGEGSRRRDVTAGEDGRFNVAKLPASSYSIIVRSVRGDASARVITTLRDGHSVDLSIVLSPIGELPLNGRNYLDLIRHAAELTPGQPGGNIEGYGPYGLSGNTSLNSNGQRGRDNNFLLDGMDNNASWLKGVIVQPPIDAIENASLLVTYLPSGIGHATGAAVTVRTQSGGNQFHASAFDYIQNSELNASNFFDRFQKPGSMQNQFGGRIGGPLKKNKWFLFADSELLRQRQGLTVISTVPTTAQKSGDFGPIPIFDPTSINQVTPGVFVRTPVPGNRIPLTSIPAPARKLIGLYPDPNLPGTADNYLASPNAIRNSNRYDVRSDQNLSTRSALFVRLSHGTIDGQSPAAFQASPFGGSDVAQHADDVSSSQTAWSGVIAHNFVWRPTLVNDFRAGIGRLDFDAHAQDQGVNASTILGIPGLGFDGSPSVQPTGYTQLGASGPAPSRFHDTNYQLADTVSWTTRRHAWKFGFQAIRRHLDATASEWTDRGTYMFTPDYTSQPGVDGTGNSIASLLFGYPSEIRRDVQFVPYRLRGWEGGGFVQDEIRLWRRLTIQAGLRYSLYPPVTEADNRMVNFNYARHAPALDQFAGEGSVNQYDGRSYNKRAIEPRVGIAMDVFGNGSTVLRGGFSKAYDTGAYLGQGSLARNEPFASRLDTFNGSLLVGPNLTDGLPAPESIPLTDPATLNRVGGAIYAVEPHGYTPYADLWGLAIEQRVRAGLALEVGLTSSMGVHLYDSYDINQPIPQSTPFIARRYSWFAPDVSRIEYLGFAGGSTYYGGHFKLTGRLRSGLHIAASYTFAKSIDDSNAPSSDQQSRPAGPQDISAVRAIRSASPFDITQRAIATAFYELPFKHRALAHWRASSVITLQTGFPFTPELAINGLNNGNFQLPDRIANGALPADQRSYLHWFDTGAFSTPPLYQFGNSGYDILRGPGLATVDASLSRSFALRERLRLEIRGEAFNLLNRTNLAMPNRILGVDSSGVISHTVTPARQIQISVRVEM